MACRFLKIGLSFKNIFYILCVMFLSLVLSCEEGLLLSFEMASAEHPLVNHYASSLGFDLYYKNLLYFLLNSFVLFAENSFRRSCVPSLVSYYLLFLLKLRF